MEKCLRSLVLEKFPFELRVEIELLSRRRDLINREKHDELMKLLRKYDMEDIVPLGPGTNRYAFKLNGFVVKVATDNDGKIDNLKEFKMAKRLYPYVTKTYEVSENGTLLVAEYIQPFESYREMCMYSDKIKDILEKLSDVYLIGDVGLTPKNYSNWGLRIGTQEPVCLDFAYVYEVKSELFVCRYCKTNSVLVPTPDFTKLQCSNPACGKYYLFEDIRAKIGNDIHRHEIGDLSEEGYPLTESGVLTQLTEERSNYLKRKEVKVEIVESVEPEKLVPDNFVMEHSPRYYIEHEEEISMSMERIIGVAEAMNRDNPNNVPILRGRVIPSTEPNDTEGKHPPVIKARVIQMVQPKAPVSDGGEVVGELAFEGSMNDDMSIPAPEPEPLVEGEGEEVQEAPVVSATVVKPEPAEVVQEETHEPMFKKSFIDHAERAISQISNYGQNTFHVNEIFDHVQTSIKEKMWPATFYKNLQNAMYHSLLAFCEFTTIEVPNDKGGTYKRYVAPKDIENPKYAPTLLFIQRYWMNKHLQEIEDLDEMMEAYQETYGEPGGFQREWLDVLKSRLMQKDKMKIDAFGISVILKYLGEMWCVPEKPVVAPEPETIPDTQPEVEHHEEAPVVPEEDPLVGDFQMGTEEAVVMRGPGADDDTEEYEEGEEEGEDTPDYLTINIVHEDDFDVVKISCDDPYGFSAIPLYCKLDEIDTVAPPSLSDNRNGVWDWLIHMSPDMLFITKDPERWLDLANGGELYQHQVHMAILDEYDDGTYLMGVSIVEGIYEFTDVDEPILNLSDEMLAKINNLICNDIGLSRISHYARSCSMRDEAKDEAYIEMVLKFQDLDEDDEGDEENVELTAAEKAALQVVMGTDKVDTQEPSDLKEAAAKMAAEIVTGAAEEIIPSEEAPVVPKEVVPEAEPVKQEESAEEPAPAETNAPAEQKKGVFKPIRRM